MAVYDPETWTRDLIADASMDLTTSYVLKAKLSYAAGTISTTDSSDEPLDRSHSHPRRGGRPDALAALFVANRNGVVTSREFNDTFARYGASTTYMRSFIRL